MKFGNFVCEEVSEAVGERRGSVTMGHQQEMTYGGSIGHVTEDVT